MQHCNDTGIGQFSARIDVTGLTEYEERTTSPDGTVVVDDLKGVHTDETFARAFPELRWNAYVDWRMNRWYAGLRFRWTDEMTTDDGSKLDSAMFTDLRLTYER